MKTQYLLLSLCMILVNNMGYAGKRFNTEDYASGIVQIEDLLSDKAFAKADKQLLKSEKHQIRTEKRMAWFSNVINKKLAKSQKKSLGGLDDPVDKWFWFWAIAWGGAIVFSFLFWPITLLLLIGGTICLILWLVNKAG